MKAPDKIYIPIVEEDGKKLLCTNWWETDARSRYVNETIPYIRKDALIGWLKEGFDWVKNPVIHVQQIIDKINSL